ncbi:MAG: PQQ-binding-like beta-propeller repeat protein, partial [Candidatus Eisenbacteria bacterium]|nr:PQQ-binding-like beta-propeller repeat protein [Candidatus Latescibacterota bacterium]MBD3301212.1 PQQ-binding-like beta-propeller repeat protein [Candidatus Eisenbacteria bacterium]
MRLLCILAIAAAIAQPAVASDWNTGVGRDAARTGLSPEVGPEAPDLLWEGSRPAIVSQQGVAGEGLFIAPRIQSFTIPTGTWIVAHDLVTGEEAWAVQLPFEEPDEWRSRVSAIRDGKVYATRAGGENQPGYLYALDPADGSILWRSEERIDEATTESASFAADGDLIVGNWDSVVRIEQTDGTTVWSVPRSTPSSNGLSVAVVGDRGYIWEPTASGPKVTAIDVEAGARLYSSAAISGGYVQQLGLFCGPDGTVYAPRTQNNPSTDYLVALEDTGAALVEKWRTPLGYVPFASFGIGPDGTIYSYSRDLEVLRLDPDTGAELDRSVGIGLDYPMQPRMAIDADGNVYVTNGGFDNGRLYAFTPDLETRWEEEIYRVNLG